MTSGQKVRFPPCKPVLKTLKPILPIESRGLQPGAQEPLEAL